MKTHTKGGDDPKSSPSRRYRPRETKEDVCKRKIEYAAGEDIKCP